MSHPPTRVAIVGGGPAGLAAAEVLAEAGMGVDLFDAMPSLGRKFLMAGRGGLNLTHSEPLDAFLARYGARQGELAPLVRAFDPRALCDWARGLGVETFVGTSGRVFPREMKAAPLLRAWVHRLREHGVVTHARHRWVGWEGSGRLRFATPDGETTHEAAAVVLALGGGSWARLGSDGAWISLLAEHGVAIEALKPSNCGFDVAWSQFFRDKFAGEPVKNVVASCMADDPIKGKAGATLRRRGEFVVSEHGVQGSLIYALSASLRDQLERDGRATLTLDLLPDRGAERVLEDVSHPRGARSLSSHLQSRVGIAGVKAALLREVLDKEAMLDTRRLAQAIKALPLVLTATRPIDEAISTAGGVRFDAMDANFMLKRLPGVFCAGEMLDWEAPTGGYLLTACIASGRATARGVLGWLRH
ncbi:aminoacetone oxidase family FAD-binding enzyme [Bordetella genomosp. 9]|uniref:Aminoacetone oxidase family FAD-binding enzyme n=1 Tax=Bordetella genomosp. 9 TaxID=1416803 RepID=A0A261RM79_9BORD|nr:TIGR03862 family flavoprotein [Bordetella genomosp. 9]OZI26166.1 aminoacetone oxidase family FAD-binding enzyme [Bordetella genomosp. 9]